MKRLKIFTTPWHTMHFYDLFNALKDDADFFLCLNSNKRWYYETRPLPKNAYFVPFYQTGKYDMAILDVDQQCVNQLLGKSKLFEEMNQTVSGIPKVIINHGSPVYPEILKRGDEETFKQAEDRCREAMKKIIGDIPMVVNSYQAASPAEWGWGIPIWHGINPDDWLDLPKEPRVFTALSPAGCDEYYNRECMVNVSQILAEKYGKTLFWARINVDTEKSFESYRQFLGRSLIYFDPSFRTPMNRGRTEAMLSGCCVIQVQSGHDLERFAKDGDNMLLTPNQPEEIAKLIAELLENGYQKCITIGQNAKQTAKEKFNYRRYREDWLKLIREL